jgi:WD40 repeat protein
MPDNNRILIRGESGVQIFDLATLAEESFLESPTNLNGPALALSPDGETLAWALDDYRIELVRVSDKQLIHTLLGHTNTVTKLRFSPNGDKLVSAAHDGWVRIWDRGNLVNAFQRRRRNFGYRHFTGWNNLATVLSMVSQIMGSAEIKRSEKLAEAVDLTLQMWVFPRMGNSSPQTWQPVYPLEATDQTLLLSGINSMAFAFSPDGRYLAYADIGENNNVVLSSPDGAQQIHTLEGHQGPVWAMVFSPDSTRLASADGIEIRIWQVQDGRLLYVGKPACP